MTEQLTYRRQEDGGYIVYAGDERLGFVREISKGSWAATDTYLVEVRGTKATRRQAVKSLLRRRDKAETQ